MVDKLERVYTVPLGKAYEAIRLKRARRAVSLLRSFVSRHMKSEDVAISNALNSFLWQHSIEAPPRKVKIRAIRENAKVKVYLHDEKLEAAKPKEENKEQKKPEEKKSEKKVEQKPTEQKAEAKQPEEKKAQEKKDTKADSKK